MRSGCRMLVQGQGKSAEEETLRAMLGYRVTEYEMPFILETDIQCGTTARTIHSRGVSQQSMSTKVQNQFKL